MPMPTARVTREFALTGHDNTVPLTLSERLLRCQVEGQFEQAVTILNGAACSPHHDASARPIRSRCCTELHAETTLSRPRHRIQDTRIH